MGLLTFISALALAALDSDRRLTVVAGETRAYLMEGRADAPGPLYVALHPRPADGAAMRWISGLSAVARSGAVVLYPDGLEGGWSPAGSDAAFLDALIAGHGRGRPVVLVGVSNGADMALSYAAARPGQLAALVLVSGGSRPETPLPAEIPPTFVMLGTEDRDFDAYADGAAAWRRAGGCTEVGRVQERESETVDHACENGVMARETRFAGQGHVWPGATQSGPLSWPEAPETAAELLSRFIAASLVVEDPPADGAR